MGNIFWLVSKIFWIVADPDNFLFIALLFGSFLLFTKRKTLGSTLIVAVTVFILGLNIFSVDKVLLSNLEDRFPFRPLPDNLDGVIVLGGAVESGISSTRKQPTVSESAERLFAFIHLKQKFPQKKFIFSGGAGGLTETHKHSDGARMVFDQVGLEVDKIIFESQSRNTYENIINSFNLIKPKNGEKWVVITSAFHMPRAMGVFRKIQWEVIPYPVDYRTTGDQNYHFRFDGFSVLTNFSNVVREWIGLFVYWVMGKTNQLFPAPEGQQ